MAQMMSSSRCWRRAPTRQSLTAMARRRSVGSCRWWWWQCAVAICTACNACSTRAGSARRSLVAPPACPAGLPRPLIMMQLLLLAAPWPPATSTPLAQVHGRPLLRNELRCLRSAVVVCLPATTRRERAWRQRVRFHSSASSVADATTQEAMTGCSWHRASVADPRGNRALHRCQLQPGRQGMLASAGRDGPRVVCPWACMGAGACVACHGGHTMQALGRVNLAPNSATQRNCHNHDAGAVHFKAGLPLRLRLAAACL